MEGSFSESKSPILPKSPEQNLSEHRWAFLGTGWGTLETFIELKETDLQRGEVKTDNTQAGRNTGLGFQPGDMEDIMDANIPQPF